MERVRSGRSFATRTVQARQRGHAIFTVTCSFVREGSGGANTQAASHAAPMPEGAEPPPPDDYDSTKDREHPAGWSDDEGDCEDDGKVPSPFESYRIRITGGGDADADGDGDGHNDKKKQQQPAHARKTRQWVRARGRISAEGGHQAHLSALAYISDSYFIGTVGRIHRLWRFPVAVDDVARLPAAARARVEKLHRFDGNGPLESFRGRPEIGMMVSLDHTIYFHNPKRVRADEWMFTEMESPWAGDGRGVVTQRIFAKDGTLLATCFQEVRFLSLSFLFFLFSFLLFSLPFYFHCDVVVCKQDRLIT